MGSVTKFAPLNVRLSNKVKGIIGALLLFSIKINEIKAIIPIIKEPKTRG